MEAGALGGRTVLGAGMVQDGRSVRWSGSAFVFEGLTGLTTHFARTLVRICSNDIWKILLTTDDHGNSQIYTRLFSAQARAQAANGRA